MGKSLHQQASKTHSSVVDVMMELLQTQIGLCAQIPRWAILLPMVSFTWISLGTTGIVCVVKE